MSVKEDKEFYYDRIALIETEGFRDLVEELDTLSDLTNKLDSIESEKDLWFAKGQLSILRQITYLEEATKAAMDNLEM